MFGSYLLPLLNASFHTSAKSIPCLSIFFLHVFLQSMDTCSTALSLCRVDNACQQVRCLRTPYILCMLGICLCSSLPSLHRLVPGSIFPFIRFITMLSGIFVPFILSVYPLMMYLFPSSFCTIAPRWANLSSLTTCTQKVISCPVALFCTVYVLSIVVVLYDQQVQQSSSTSPLLEIFCSSNFSPHS
jgi:hypothetical protein